MHAPRVATKLTRNAAISRVGETEPFLQARGRAALLPTDIAAGSPAVATPVVYLRAPGLRARARRLNAEERHDRHRRERDYQHPHGKPTRTKNRTPKLYTGPRRKSGSHGGIDRAMTPN